MLFQSKHKVKSEEPAEKKGTETVEKAGTYDEVIEVPKKKEKTKIRIAVAKRK